MNSPNHDRQQEKSNQTGRGGSPARSTVAVLVIDMQNAFFEAPGLRQRQDGVVEACNTLVSAASSQGVPVMLVKTEHERDRSTWTLNMLDDNQGFIFRGSRQADFVPGLRTDGLPQMVKTRDSAFLGTDLLMRLRNWGVDSVVLAGVSTHNCVAQTAADAFAHNIRVTFAEDAITSEDPDSARNMLAILSREYRQPILGLDEVIAGFGGT